MEKIDNYYISLFDKETRKLSDRIPLKDVVYNQNEIEFIFPNDEIGETTLPYSDFLFYSQDYEVVLEVGGEDE